MSDALQLNIEMPLHVTMDIHDSKVKFMGTCPGCGKVVKALKVPEMEAPGGTAWTRWKNQANAVLDCCTLYSRARGLLHGTVW